ncbi:hypothetical protein [Limibacterium fermenti]|uniref:hypothetical protein n=2 Tax=Limibacterium fermenti TaxID=3229863 RepID=UPI003A789F8A
MIRKERNNYIPYIYILLLCFFAVGGLKAQSEAGMPGVEIRQSFVNDQIISHIIKVGNPSAKAFHGFITPALPEGVRNLTATGRELTVAPGDSTFVSYKLVMAKNIPAGRKTVAYTLFDDHRKQLLRRETHIDIEKRERIFLAADEAPILVTHPEDSIRISVLVNNSGNTEEEVTLVFNVPQLRGAPPFTEIKTTVKAMEQKPVVYAFIPSANLLSAEQFPVHITAMKGKEKTLFGNKTVTVQNAASNRPYIDVNPNVLFSGYGSDDNALTLSYRQYNASSGMWQARGGGYVNLPAGYLQVQGNLYQYSSQRTPMVTNTSLMYKLYENEFTVGNVSEQAELPLYGRGAKAMFSDDKKDKTFTVGAIDQNFNLLSSEAWFADYYSFYAVGTVGASNYKNGAEVSYVYQRNPYEKAYYNVAGAQWRRGFGNDWDIDLKAHGSVSRYEGIRGNKFSGSGELRYQGKLFSDLMLNGSAYYSDGYFPGSRKGSLSLSQGLSQKLSQTMYVSGNVSYNKTEPKSYAYDYRYSSENVYGNAHLSLPKLGRWSPSLFYQYRGERSSSYASYFGAEVGDRLLDMPSNRGGVQLRWNSRNGDHSIYGSVEGGAYGDPLDHAWRQQWKSSLDYSYKWLTVNSSWQRGAFYLYEYAMARQNDTGFNRFAVGASVNKDFSKKVSLTSNVNFTKDTYQGNVPSANLTVKYRPNESYSFFSNAYWYQYNYAFMGRKTNTYNIEVGATWHFSKAQPSSKKKSTIIAQLYYDKNANSRYDKGDEPVNDYVVALSNKAFITDKDGKIRYSLTPYGDYTIKPMSASSWYFRPVDVTVNRSKTKVDIPLTQSGTLRGNIRYIFGKHSVDLVPRYEGLRFIITNTHREVEHVAVTDGQGNFMTFLPVGEYSITLDKSTLLKNTDCKDFIRSFRIEAGEVNKLEPFTIETKSRNVNIKQFSQ